MSLKAFIVLLIYYLTSIERIKAEETDRIYPPLLYVLQSKLLFLHDPHLYQRLLENHVTGLQNILFKTDDVINTKTTGLPPAPVNSIATVLSNDHRNEASINDHRSVTTTSLNFNDNDNDDYYVAHRERRSFTDYFAPNWWRPLSKTTTTEDNSNTKDGRRQVLQRDNEDTSSNDIMQEEEEADFNSSEKNGVTYDEGGGVPETVEKQNNNNNNVTSLIKSDVANGIESDNVNGIESDNVNGIESDNVNGIESSSTTSATTNAIGGLFNEYYDNYIPSTRSMMQNAMNGYDDYIPTQMMIQETANGYLQNVFDYYSPISIAEMQDDAYLSRILIVLRIVNFFFSPLGFIDQIMFVVKVCSIAWKAAQMYNDGQSGTNIAWEVAPEVISVAMMSRRDEEQAVNEEYVKPGQIITVSNMDVPTFLEYVQYLKYPSLGQMGEQTLLDDITNIVDSTFTSTEEYTEAKKNQLTTALVYTVKFMVLYGQKGEVKRKKNEDDLSAISEVINNVKFHPSSVQQEYTLKDNIAKIIGNGLVASKLTDFIKEQFSNLPV